MTNTETRELVYLAGLLHDIGKFNKAVESLWQASQFYQEPTNDVQAIIKKADAWATAIDQQQVDSRAVIQPLKNLFDDLLIKEKQGQSDRFGFHKLSLDTDIVLRKTPGDLDHLRKEFATDFRQLPTDDFTVFAGTLYHLLRQYTWSIPASSGSDFESISLFHHLKLTGAFAQCLFDAQTDEAIDGKPVQLLCVDLSGIQSFIYNIGSKYAAKSLKGRSFSLQLLLDLISRELVKETNTSASHVVYSSGGKFFMLLPHTAKINAILAITEKVIQQSVWDTYQGNLFVCFGRVAFDYDPVSNAVITPLGKGSLSDLWKQVTQKAAEQKAQKNKALILDEVRFTNLFWPTGKGGEEKQCPVTGWEGPLVVTKDKKTEVHQTVKDQIDIGSQLQDASFITFGDGPFNLLNDSTKSLSPFDLTNNRAEFSDKSEYSQLIQPGKKNNFLDGRSLNHVIRSFRFYGGSRQAMSIVGKGQAKNFEELAGTVRADLDDDYSEILTDKCSGKYRRLAVLRMDVDSLGDLFTRGLPPEKSTFSAYATLSGLLDWFFSGYLNTIREQYADWVNIVYSGGDDVFAVGRWDKIIDFADHIQKDFKTFTGRPDLTISAGIVLMRPRYPIGKAADQAGEAEDLAKDHIYNGLQKNAISLFNLAVNWDKEWPFVTQYHQKFVDWLHDGILSKGILQKLFAYYDIYAKGEAEYRAAKKRGQDDYKPDLSWKWNAAYTLSRHRNINNSAVIDELKNLLFTRINDSNVRFDALAMAMRWAELTVRDDLKTKQDDNGIDQTRKD